MATFLQKAESDYITSSLCIILSSILDVLSHFLLYRSGSRSGSVRIAAPDDGIDSEEEDENRK